MSECRTCQFFEANDDQKGGLCRFAPIPISVSETGSCPGHLLPGQAPPEEVPFPEEEGHRLTDLEYIREYVSQVEWRFAKTMPDAPHWYTVLNWGPSKRWGFFHLARVIFELGQEEVWVAPNGASYRRKYFRLDGFKYWSMDPSSRTTDLINRALISEEAPR